MSVFDPTTRIVTRPELQIRAESLFTVIDSASAVPEGTWVAAHRDTVRAWRIDDSSHGLTTWVDGAGRLVASQVGDISIIRTAFEIAFKNFKASSDTLLARRKQRKNSRKQ